MTIHKYIYYVKISTNVFTLNVPVFIVLYCIHDLLVSVYSVLTNFLKHKTRMIPLVSTFISLCKVFYVIF